MYQRVIKRDPKNVSQSKAQQQEPSIPEYDHNQCTWHYPYHTVPSATSCFRGVACTTPPATPAPATTLVRSPKSVLPSPSSSCSGATAPYSNGSPGTPNTTTSFRTTTPTRRKRKVLPLYNFYCFQNANLTLCTPHILLLGFLFYFHLFFSMARLFVTL